MDTSKSILLVLGLTLVLFAGCIGPAPEDYVTEGGSSALNVTENETEELVEVEPACEPSYEFSGLPEKGVIGQPVQFSVVSTCAKNKIIGLNIDELQESGGSITTNDPVNFNFVLMPEVEGTKQLVVWSDADAIYNESWEVLPIGSTDTSGSKNDGASVSEWLATSFEIQNSIKVRSVGMYLKRLHSQTMQHSMILVDIRADDGGQPSENYITVDELPITDTTLTENWIYFNFGDSIELEPGKYWVVLRVTQETQDQIVSDVVNLHYTFDGDTTVPGNEYTKRMRLEWDNDQRKFAKTNWEPLAYDRTYSVIVSGLEH